jgi:DNA-binding GntR family transcriptional regulator
LVRLLSPLETDGERTDVELARTADRLRRGEWVSVTSVATGNSRSRAASEDGAEAVDVYGAIREAILAGRHAPGQRLIEARLAAELGVSRTRIRDGLARLEAEHLVVRAPNRGVMVRPLTSADIEEIYSLRLLLESYGARTAATNITTPEIQRLKATQAEMGQLERQIIDGAEGEDRLPLVRGVTELNNEFHRIIQQASRNARLLQILRTVIDVPLVFRSFYWYTDSELVEAAREHEAIIEALEQRDGERSEALMRAHISRGLNTLRREISGAR